ncbi:MAG: DUF2357 domain-containing protein [Kiritimatiellia bacterium]
MSNAIKIPLQSLRTGESECAMELYPVKDAFYAEIDAVEAKANGEVQWQIREGCEYEYMLPVGYHFRKHPTISQSARKATEGRIRPGNYVGRLSLAVIDDNDAVVGAVELESTSVKMDYRTDYQTMLNDLAEESAELLMSSDEFVFQHFEVDPTADAETLYQQFAFAKSLVVSDAFDAAVARVCASPIKAMQNVREARPAAKAGRLGRDGVRQLASASKRDPLPPNHYLARHFGWDSVPHEIEYDAREESVDVPENRFVKFVLESFMDFLRDMALLDNASETLKAEAEALAEKLDYRLGDPLFRSVSRLDRLPLSSPALQRREGYREILRAWLMFESAAKIAWEGGEDVYKGGKRNVAVLYEYWAFFKLLEIVSNVFDFPKKELERLIVRGKNSLELSLRQGKTMTFKGMFAPADGSRPLKAQFTYNKTFKHKDNLEVQGSWTVDMRPDYTLSIWPAVIQNIDDAEKIDAVVHIHFDAKYKIDKFVELFASNATQDANVPEDGEGAEADPLSTLKEEEDKGVYKRGDLLKMHAYNDAIRRTYGSYILYPGDKDDPKRRYRELIPGIGAFVLRPGKQEMAGASKIEDFIRKVTYSLQNRLTQRERTAVYDWSVRRFNPVDLPVAARNVVLPDENSRGGAFVPAEEPLLVGYYRPEKWEWIKKNGYNFRIGLRNGSLGISSDELKADYILLHCGSSVTNQLFKIDKDSGPKLVTKQEMIHLGYGDPSGDAYLLFKLIPIGAGEPLHGLTCDISKLPQYAGARSSTRPFTVMFQDILLHGVCG